MGVLIFANSANASPCACSDHTETNKSGNKIGKCLSTFGGSTWCYVASDSSCPDKKQSSRNNQLYWSISACQQTTGGGSSSSSSSCLTVGGDDVGSPCVFPFIYHDRSYSKCTLSNADDGLAWCSTKVDAEGAHVGGEGKWGQCSQDCPTETEADAVITTTPDPSVLPEGLTEEQRNLILQNQPSSNVRRSGYWANNWDGHLKFECPSGQGIRHMSGYHDNHREDRLFHFECQPVNFESSTCGWSGYVNGFDDNIDHRCNGNDLGVLVGLESYHSNREEDRRWNFKCCSVGSLDCEWTGYINGWDGWMGYTIPKGWRIAGSQSHHSNRREDRRWRLRICRN